MRLATLFFLVFFLVVKPAYSDPRNDDDASWWLGCRRCKVYARDAVGGAPENSSSGSGQKTNVGAVVGLTSLLLVVIVVFIVWIYCATRESENGVMIKPDVARKEIVPQQTVLMEGNVYSGGLQKFTFHHLTRITYDFGAANKIGGGGYGVVYKATLKDGTKVAVKCLRPVETIDHFKNEVEALSRADHPNLVKLIGYCDEGITRILVYEYMRKGSLDKWIFHTDPKKTLTWPEMKKIIEGIAKGLLYLHEKCEKKILHRDLKPSNVVLDEKKNAKVCDFGLAKLMDKSQTSTSTRERGSAWYMAPEVCKNKRISEKVDVYSFGIVVLEIVFGKPYDHLVTSDQYSQTEEVKLHDLIKSLSDEMQRNGEEILKIGEIAVSCLRENPEERPSMSVVLDDLPGLKAKETDVENTQ